LSPQDVLAALAGAGVTLFAQAGRLRYRAARGAYTPELRALVDANRAELLALLAGPPWDAADAALAEALALIAEAQAGATRPARQRVLGIVRGLGERYHRERDPLLFQMFEPWLGIAPVPASEPSQGTEPC
jgi:hypothetical protein